MTLPPFDEVDSFTSGRDGNDDDFTSETGLVGVGCSASAFEAARSCSILAGLSLSIFSKISRVRLAAHRLSKKLWSV